MENTLILAQSAVGEPKMTFSMVGLLVLVLIIGGIGWLLLRAGANHKSPFWVFLLQMVPIIFFLFLLVLAVSHRVVEDQKETAEREKARVEQVAREKTLGISNEGVSKVVPLDEAWEDFNRSRIHLEDGKDEPAAKPADDAEAPDHDATAEGKLPKWLMQPPEQVLGTYLWMVTSNRFRSVDECRDDLQKRFEQSVDKESAAQLARFVLYHFFDLKAVGILDLEETTPGQSDEGRLAESIPTDKKQRSPIQLTAATEPEESEQPAAAEVPPPDWVVHPPKRIGNTYRRVVVSDPFSTTDECYRDLEPKLRQAVYEQIASQHPAVTDERNYVNRMHGMYLPLDYILREICHGEYVESIDATFGEMKKVHLLMEFDQSIMQHLNRLWKNYQRQERLQGVVRFAGAGLLVLGLAYGMLKFDTFTRGYYTRRLLLGSGVAIIGVLVLLFFLNFA